MILASTTAKKGKMMRMRKIVIGLTVGACLFLNIPAVPAENWVAVPGSFIDVDSIYKADDGLTYYLLRNNPSAPGYKYAFDCVTGHAYYELNSKKSRSVIPGTAGEVIMKFVCSRVR